MKTGDKVVYIKRTLPDIGLVNGRVYTTLSTEHCGGCKDSLAIDIGFTQGSCGYCEDCNTIINIDDRYMFHNSGFRLANEDDLFIEKHLDIIKEKTEKYTIFKI